MIVASKTV